MPRPVFIIASQSFAIDQHTNLLSVFHILEGLEVTKNPIPQAQGDVKLAVQTLPLAINAVWMRLDDDSPDTEFEYDMTLKPPGGPEMKLGEGSFTFSKQYYRLTAMIQHLGPPADQSGMLYVASRIRRVGTTDWMCQDYPFPIKVRGADSNATDAE